MVDVRNQQWLVLLSVALSKQAMYYLKSKIEQNVCVVSVLVFYILSSLRNVLLLSACVYIYNKIFQSFYTYAC